MSIEKSPEDLIAEAARHAQALSLVLTEAQRRGLVIDVEIDRVPIAGQGDLVQVMVHPKRLPLK